VILVDSNILMYAAGSAHPNKSPSIRFLESVAEGSIDAAVDAEVLQEILHRYRALNRWDDGKRVYDAARRIFAVVLPVTADDLDVARGLLNEHDSLTARDALHAGIVRNHGLDGICSFDRDFDVVPRLKRIEPR
jgi:predicted nucleic acid-binding protein